MSNIERVLKAISDGSRLWEEIARNARVCQRDTRTHLTRLCVRGTIKSVRVGKRAHYVPQNMGCLLADVWRGAAG